MVNLSFDNIDDRWKMIGELVEEYGTEEEKLAWALCRGDAAEWRLGTEKNARSKND